MDQSYIRVPVNGRHKFPEPPPPINPEIPPPFFYWPPFDERRTSSVATKTGSFDTVKQSRPVFFYHCYSRFDGRRTRFFLFEEFFLVMGSKKPRSPRKPWLPRIYRTGKKYRSSDVHSCYIAPTEWFYWTGKKWELCLGCAAVTLDRSSTIPHDCLGENGGG